MSSLKGKVLGAILLSQIQLHYKELVGERKNLALFWCVRMLIVILEGKGSLDYSLPAPVRFVVHSWAITSC